MFIPLAIDILEEPKTAANTAMPVAPTSATPAAPTFFFFLPYIPQSPLQIHSFIFFHSSHYISCFSPGPTRIKVPSSFRFEFGSNSSIVPDLVSEAAAFFI